MGDGGRFVNRPCDADGGAEGDGGRTKASPYWPLTPNIYPSSGAARHLPPGGKEGGDQASSGKPKREMNSSSVRMGTPRERAFWFLVEAEAASLLMRKLVFFDTLPATLPPQRRR